MRDPFASTVPADEPAPDWRELAACGSEDPELFQPDHPSRGQLDRALQVCAACPVQAACAREAKAPGHEPYGVWAGEWHGPWNVASGDEALTDELLAELVGEGLSDGAVAARFEGVTRDRVRYRRLRLGLRRAA